MKFPGESVFPVTLPILIHTESSSSMNKLGIGYDIMDCEVRDMIFFSINGIMAYTDDNYSLPSPFSEVHANGSEYICALSIDELKKKLGIQ